MSYVECPHYKRKCYVVAPCCKEPFPCRLCHNEKTDHSMNRRAVKSVICKLCGNLQAINMKCVECHTLFGKYYCLTCNFFDDEYKGQFHCSGCGICRIGGRENYFHCMKCGLCLNKNIENTHKCVENASHADCPICLENIHHSVKEIYVPNCGHLLHKTCYEDLNKASYTKCSVCKKSM